MDNAYRRAPRYYSATGVSHVPRNQTAGASTSSNEQILIAVLGVTGAGKSSFINRATESSVLEVGDDIESCQC